MKGGDFLNKKRKWLEYKRGELGLTQLEVSEMLGMKQPQYSRYETGESEPNAINKARIARVLNFDIDEWRRG